MLACQRWCWRFRRVEARAVEWEKGYSVAFAWFVVEGMVAEEAMVVVEEEEVVRR